jgi:inorganic pyrophosphatase
MPSSPLSLMISLAISTAFSRKYSRLVFKILPAGLVFPFDFIPDTKGEDGDPLDIIVVS